MLAVALFKVKVASGQVPPRLDLPGCKEQQAEINEKKHRGSQPNLVHE